MSIEKNTFKITSLFFLFLSMFSTVFSFQDGVGVYFQLCALFFISLSGILCFFINGGLNYLSRFELAMFFSILSSLFTSLLYGHTYSVQYTILLFIFCLSATFIVRAHSLKELTKVYGYAAAAIIFTVFALEYSHLQDSINVSITSSGLIRFTPLGMHPNLTGVVYSGTAIVLFFLFLNTHSVFLKWTYLALSLIGISFTLAASARGSLLMLFVAFVFWLIRLIRVGGIKNLSLIFVVAGTLIIFIVANFSIIYEYLAGMLEIESNSRGVDSGGTGRTELWAMGVNGLVNEPLRFLFGAGFRSAEEGDIGFSLESSYLVLLYEVGVFNTLTIVFCIYSSVSLIFKKAKSTVNGVLGFESMIFYLSLFFILQSFFNRYLISIGSFFTVFFLLMVFSASLGTRLRFKF